MIFTEDTIEVMMEWVAMGQSERWGGMMLDLIFWVRR